MRRFRDTDFADLSLGQILVLLVAVAPMGFVFTILAGFIKTGTQILDDGLGGLLLIGLGGSILFVVAMLLTIAWDRLWRRSPY